MEKGEIRFHGPTAELLDRPDVLRSVFLEGAAAGLARSAAESTADQAAATAPATRPFRTAAGVEPDVDAVGNGDRSGDGPASGRRRRRPPGPRARGRRRDPGVRRHPGGRRRRLAVAPRRDRRHHRAQRRRQDHAVRPRLGLPAGRRRPGAARRAATSPALRADGRARRRPRPVVPGRPPVPGADGRRSASRSRSSGGSRCATRSRPRCTCPAAFDAERAVARAGRRAGRPARASAPSARKFVHELSTGSRRIVDLACLVAHRPTVVLLDEPSSGIAQRETEALAPVIARIRDRARARAS